MSTTDLAVIDHLDGHDIALFDVVTPGDVVTAASVAANALADVIERKRLYQTIKGRKHVLIEGWQTLGSMCRVFVERDGGVEELPWPECVATGDLSAAPPIPGVEPRRAAPEWPAWQAQSEARERWERLQRLHDARALGQVYGFKAAFHATRDGRRIGWGEGRCTRAEKRWSTAEDYAVASMAQTRGQSRTLSSVLKFVVSLAGYAPTPAEDMGDGNAPESQPVSPEETPALPFGPLATQEQENEAAGLLQPWHLALNMHHLIAFYDDQLGVESMPLAAYRLVKAIDWATRKGGERFANGAPADEPENAPPDPARSAYHNHP